MSETESSKSSPEPPQAPKFTLELIESRDQEFVIISIRNSDSKVHRVTRSFHDFQFLEQQLFYSGQTLSGYIIPPLLERLVAKEDEHQLFCWLRLIIEHPLFGHSGLLEPFLTEKTIPPPGKILRPFGLIKSIQDTIDSRKYTHKDCDIFFQNERDWSAKASELMQEATEAFKSSITARHSLTQVLAHLSAALGLPTGDDELDKITLKMNLAFAKGLEGHLDFVAKETDVSNSTLGVTLVFWTRYLESEKEMLKQRTCLLLDYEAANRNFDRAQYQRRPEVEEAKTSAERAFEKCSEIARAEIKRFQATRVKDLAKSLCDYRTSQLALAKEHYDKLSELYQQVGEELRAAYPGPDAPKLK